jgi:hypothetical protein
MDRTPVRWRSVTPAVGSAGMADGGSGHADTSNSGPTRAASQANLRDHAIWLRNCAEVATAKAKPAAAINLIILLLPCLRYSFPSRGKGNSSIIQAKSDYKSLVRVGSSAIGSEPDRPIPYNFSQNLRSTFGWLALAKFWPPPLKP